MRSKLSFSQSSEFVTFLTKFKLKTLLLQKLFSLVCFLRIWHKKEKLTYYFFTKQSFWEPWITWKVFFCIFLSTRKIILCDKGMVILLFFEGLSCGPPHQVYISQDKLFVTDFDITILFFPGNSRKFNGMSGLMVRKLNSKIDQLVQKWDYFKHSDYFKCCRGILFNLVHFLFPRSQIIMIWNVFFCVLKISTTWSFNLDHCALYS